MQVYPVWILGISLLPQAAPLKKKKKKQTLIDLQGLSELGHDRCLQLDLPCPSFVLVKTNSMHVLGNTQPHPVSEISILGLSRDASLPCKFLWPTPGFLKSSPAPLTYQLEVTSLSSEPPNSPGTPSCGLYHGMGQTQKSDELRFNSSLYLVIKL